MASERAENSTGGRERTPEFVQLLLRHEQPIRAYIMTMLAHWADVDEVLQETSLTLWQKFESFETGTDFRAWAYRIAYYTTLNFLQKKQRNRVQFSSEFIEHLAARPTTVEGLQARQEALEQCVQKLSATDRQLIQLRYQRETSTAEVGAQLGRPLKSVYRSLNRIHATLLNCVDRALARESNR